MRSALGWCSTAPTRQTSTIRRDMRATLGSWFVHSRGGRVARRGSREVLEQGETVPLERPAGPSGPAASLQLLLLVPDQRERRDCQDVTAPGPRRADAHTH